MSDDKGQSATNTSCARYFRFTQSRKLPMRLLPSFAILITEIIDILHRLAQENKVQAKDGKWSITVQYMRTLKSPKSYTAPPPEATIRVRSPPHPLLVINVASKPAPEPVQVKLEPLGDPPPAPAAYKIFCKATRGKLLQKVSPTTNFPWSRRRFGNSSTMRRSNLSKRNVQNLWRCTTKN